MTNPLKTSSRRRTAGVIIASTVALTAVGLALDAAKLPIFSPALADPVHVEAPNIPSFANVVAAVSPAVVSVRVEQEFKPVSDRQFSFDRRGDNGNGNNLPPFLRNNPFFRDYPFFRDGPQGDRRGPPPRRYGMAQGSGFFVSDDGYIVTNHHVVENGSKFTVVLENGDELPATLVGADARTDLAVLKVKADQKFTYVKFATDKAQIGDWVVAVGNPFGLGGTVTAGIVSASNREISTNRYDDFIQIDAAVNKGNSGGPAFNLNGEVIGINTAIFSPSGGNVGIAFAIPASTANEVVNDLIHNGTVVRGWLGVEIQPVTKDIADSLGMSDNAGAIVTSPQDGSPAQKAGIHSGDVITAVNGQKVKGPRELAQRIGNLPPESKVAVTVWRDGKSSDVNVTLGKLDDSQQQASLTPDNGGGMRSLARLGLDVQPNDNGKGVVITDVVPGSGADRKGVQPGDVILSVNGNEASTAEDVLAAIRNAESNGRHAALFQIKRGDKNPSFVAIPFGQGPGKGPARGRG